MLITKGHKLRDIMMPPVRRLTVAELPAVARTHLAAFPDSLLSRLGPEVVARYYAWQISDANDASIAGVLEDGDVLGFAVGGMFRDTLNGFFRSNRPLIAAAVVRQPRLVLDGLFWQRFRIMVISFRREHLKKRRDAGPVPKQSATAKPRRRYVVLSICTHPDHQRKGIGASLLAFQEARAKRLGHEKLWLTVSPDNVGALDFYRNQGYKAFEEAEGWAGKMMKSL